MVCLNGDNGVKAHRPGHVGMGFITFMPRNSQPPAPGNVQKWAPSKRHQARECASTTRLSMA